MTALLFALSIVALSLVLIVFTVHHMMDTVMKLHVYDADKVTKNHSICKGRIIDRYDILAVLVGCVIGLILGIAMESGI